MHVVWAPREGLEYVGWGRIENRYSNYVVVGEAVVYAEY